MKAQTEIEKTATRRIAKAIIELSELEEWRKIESESEVAVKVGQAVAQKSMQIGRAHV